MWCINAETEHCTKSAFLRPSNRHDEALRLLTEEAGLWSQNCMIAAMKTHRVVSKVVRWYFTGGLMQDEAALGDMAGRSNARDRHIFLIHNSA
jgi:hypothetical protein